jgi:hypothetical protein
MASPPPEERRWKSVPSCSVIPFTNMLIVFPLSLLGSSPGFDLVAIIRGYPTVLQASFYMIAVGIVTALVAAIFGLDFSAIPAMTRGSPLGSSTLPAPASLDLDKIFNERSTACIEGTSPSN